MDCICICIGIMSSKTRLRTRNVPDFVARVQMEEQRATDHVQHFKYYGNASKMRHTLEAIKKNLGFDGETTINRDACVF